MRHVDIEATLRKIAKTEGGQKTIRRIRGAHTKLARMKSTKRKGYLKRNGTRKWSPLKLEFEKLLGKKCWYTEVEIVGASLTVDHFRPQCNYWFLALDPSNYRVACPYANSPNHNPLYGCAGGKGDEFPLIGNQVRATGKNKCRRERPGLLDPCNPHDCKLIVFLETGRPTIHPQFAADAEAKLRVEMSLIRLNIDHPDFNSKREQLYHDIHSDVRVYEQLPLTSIDRDGIRARLSMRIRSTAQFSIAAHQYLSRFRYLDWVEDILAE